MVEKIIVTPEKIRCLGNIAEIKTVEDFDRHESSVIEGTVRINGIAQTAFSMIYSENNFSFGFDGNGKRLYVSFDDDLIESFSFDTTNKRLALSSDSIEDFDFSSKKLVIEV